MQNTGWNLTCALLLATGFRNFATADDTLSGQAIRNPSGASKTGNTDTKDNK